MVLQSWSTMDTFISFRTTVAISKETSNSLPPPTIVLCQEHKWNNGHFGVGEDKANFYDKDWVLKQFFQLNDKMNITFTDYDSYNLELTIGNNTVSINGLESNFIVKELLNPWNGLCYAIIPDSSMAPMKKSTFFMAKIGFSQEIKNPILSAYLIHPEDWYGFMIPYFGMLKPSKIPLTEFGAMIGIQLQQRKYFHVQDTFYLPSSMTKCKNYSSEEDSYMKCLVKSQVDYFESFANDTNSGCACIPILPNLLL